MDSTPTISALQHTQPHASRQWQAELSVQVVSKVDAEGNPFTRGAAANDWKVSQDLFPVEVPSELEAQLKKVTKETGEAWGGRQLTPLEAEDRLAVACEKAPTDDPILANLRSIFQVRP